jgi:SAM-dependent methyltransferase
MTLEEFTSRARAIADELGIRDAQHGYFEVHRDRLHGTCEHFRLFNRELGDVLEVGPFYSYTPILLRPNARSYRIIEGIDPTIEPLIAAYQKHKVAMDTLLLGDIFGGLPESTFRLPYPDGSFDTVLCWETMEHFNFNPVPFVRELFRILKPGGEACLTVPNRASLESLTTMMSTGRAAKLVDSYYTFENFLNNGRRVFLGFHWREYTLAEFAHLFRRAGFHIEEQGWLLQFHNEPHLTFPRRMQRAAWRAACALRPSLGKNCYLRVIKPKLQANNS